MDTLKNLRQNFSLKICYKKKYNFLNLKHTPSHGLACRLTKKGNFIKSFKLLKKFYYVYILRLRKKTISIHSSFLFLYNKYASFKNFDRVLFWKFKSLNCMFSHKCKYFKKKKKTIKKLSFVFSKKRLLLSINFVKYLILLDCKRKEKKFQFKLFSPLYDFITNDRSNSVLKVKLQIYKLKISTVN